MFRSVAMKHIPTAQKQEILQNHSHNAQSLVNADVIGKRYGISGRYVLKLASEGKIPSLKIGRKCVRFDPNAVAKALGA